MIHDLIIDNFVDIMCITETWLSENETAAVSAFVPDTHIFHHFPRPSGRGGGVGIVVSKFFKFTKFFRRLYDTFECLELNLVFKNYKINIYTIYRPPNADRNVFFSEFSSFLTDSEMRNDKNFYVGDFNFWLNDLNNPYTVEFLDIVSLFSLHNYVQCSTYDSGNTLHLVITKSDSTMINNVQVEPTNSISGHKAVFFQIELEVLEKNNKCNSVS